MDDVLKLAYIIDPVSFEAAGEASSDLKRVLKSIGLDPGNIKRAVIALYEAEINAFLHGGGGRISIEITKESISARVEDDGPGIEDIELAMREGYSTASDEIRQLGFGAGMGLPNIQRNTDSMKIESEAGKGTRLEFEVSLTKR